MKIHRKHIGKTIVVHNLHMPPINKKAVLIQIHFACQNPLYMLHQSYFLLPLSNFKAVSGS